MFTPDLKYINAQRFDRVQKEFLSVCVSSRRDVATELWDGQKETNT